MFQLKVFQVIFTLCLFLLIAPVIRCQNFDIDLLKKINPQYPQPGFLKTTSDTYIFVTSTLALGSLTYALIENDKNLTQKSFELMIAIGINTFATGSLKVIFDRPRPVEKYPNEVFVLTVSEGHSFPSGHTSTAFATATSLMLTHKKWYITVPAYLWAGCIGYSRMYLGQHYPSDVLGGMIVGTGSSLVSHWLSKKIFKKAPEATKKSNKL